VLALGTAGATVLWTASILIGFCQNLIFAEVALMFPNTPGGISLFAGEAWRRYFSLVGPIATFGYWFAWSSVLAINGLVVGTLIQAKWFASTTWSTSGGHFLLSLPIFIGIGIILSVWIFNVIGMRIGLWVGYVTGALLMIPLVVLMFGGYVSGEFHDVNMTFNFGGSAGDMALLALTWMYFMGWSGYGFEAVATFAPEYQKPRHDLPTGLMTAAVFSVLVYALLPLGTGGVLGTKAISGDPTAIAFFVTAFTKIVGSGGADVMIVFMCAGLILSMNTATMDGSRALYGVSKDGMTLKLLGKLNHYHVPANAMTLDMLLNIWLLTFFHGALPIIAAGNLGYFLAHIFAQSGFFLLRKDRPDWPRPYRLSRVLMPVAGFVLACNIAFMVMGGWVEADKYGYGLSKTLIGLAVLCIGVLAFVYRRYVEDRKSIKLREETPKLPDEETARVFEAMGVHVPGVAAAADPVAAG
ncbi:MAG: APC family permease, partial [Solirubrobacteraceae bacterium]